MIQLPETRLQLKLLPCFTFSLFHYKNAEEWRLLATLFHMEVIQKLL